MPAKIRNFAPTALKLLLIIAIGLAFAAFWYINTLPTRADDQQTIIIGPTRFAPASEAALRVVVQDVGGGQPVSNAEIKVSLWEESGGQAIRIDQRHRLDNRVTAVGNFQLIVVTQDRTRVVIQQRDLSQSRHHVQISQ